MNSIRNLLLIPTLTPLLIVIFVSTLNLNKPVKLRILTWNSPQLNLGLLMTIAASTSAFYASVVSISLTNSSNGLRRRVIIEPQSVEDMTSSQWRSFEDEPSKESQQEKRINFTPERGLKDPFPTVEVPFRIINKNINSKRSDDSLYNNINKDKDY